jgi:hypothetical protein
MMGEHQVGIFRDDEDLTQVHFQEHADAGPAGHTSGEEQVKFHVDFFVVLAAALCK